MSSKIFCKSWGAEYIAADVVRFRLWATGQQKVMLRLAGKDQEMQANGDGWFTLDVSGVTPGTEYNFVLSDGMVVPDPASRAQKTDVNGPSYVVDPGSYAWRNTGWKGSRWEQAVGQKGMNLVPRCHLKVSITSLTIAPCPISIAITLTIQGQVIPSIPLIHGYCKW